MLLALALAIAGCGGGDSKKPGNGRKSAKAVAGPPRPKDTLANAVSGFEQAVASGSCKDLGPFMLHSSMRGPGRAPDLPPSAEECARIVSIQGQVLRGFRATKTKQYGPTAVVEGTGDKAGKGEVVATVWALDTDGSWKSDVWGLFAPQIGHKPKPSLAFDAGAQAFAGAAQKGDCNTFWRVLDPGSRFVEARRGGRPQLCKDMAASYKRGDSALRDIADDRGRSKPQHLGQTPDFGLYGLNLSNGRYVAIVMSTQAQSTTAAESQGHANPAVLDYLTLRKPTR